jgi:hypothetical protein
MSYEKWRESGCPKVADRAGDEVVRLLSALSEKPVNPAVTEALREIVSDLVLVLGMDLKMFRPLKRELSGSYANFRIRP